MDNASGLGGSHKLPAKTVYIFNMSEDVWPFINAMTNDKDRINEIQENAYLEDLRLFIFSGEDDHVYFICPAEVNEEFLTYYKDLFGNKHITIITMPHHGGEICEDIRKDETVIEQLIEIANSSRRLTITSYATTPQF